MLSSGLAGTEIVAAIGAVAAGMVVLDTAGIEPLLRAPSTVSSSGAEALAEALTPREVEVLQLLAAGLGNKEIASRRRFPSIPSSFTSPRSWVSWARPAAPKPLPSASATA
jgi:DNA-binding NarL/FixJ family response regulator